MLEQKPELWVKVYVSEALQTQFKEALQRQDKQTLAELVKQEPRLVTFHNMELIKFIITTQDAKFVEEVIISNIQLRGQKERMMDGLLLAAEMKWASGMQLFIKAQSWTESDYLACARNWLRRKKIEPVKLLLHHMQKQNIKLDITDDNDNNLLHHAAEIGGLELVTLLLSRGLDSQAKNKDDKTPEELATLNNHTQVMAKFKAFHLQSQGGTGSNLQVQMLENEVQELKNQLHELRIQTQHNQQQMFKALSYSAPLFFASVKQKANKYPFASQTKVFGEYSAKVRGLAVLPNRQVVSGSEEDHTLRIWDIKSGQCLKIINSDAQDHSFYKMA